MILRVHSEFPRSLCLSSSYAKAFTYEWLLCKPNLLIMEFMNALAKDDDPQPWTRAAHLAQLQTEIGDFQYLV